VTWRSKEGKVRTGEKAKRKGMERKDKKERSGREARLPIHISVYATAECYLNLW